MNDRGYLDLSSPTLHLSIILSLTIFVAILSASFFIDIEIIAQGAGKIIPAAKVQVVQSEYSGQVKSIFVKNGARVDKGQLLIELDSTDARAQLRTVKEEIQRLTIERYRIRSLLVEFSNANSTDDLSGFNASLRLSDITAEYTLEIKHSEEDFKQPFLRDQHGLMTSEIAEFRSSLASFFAQIDANNKSHSIIEANIERIDALLLIHEERHQASTTLSRKGIISRASYLNTIEHLTNLQKQRNIHCSESINSSTNPRRTTEISIGIAVEVLFTKISDREPYCNTVTGPNNTPAENGEYEFTGTYRWHCRQTKYSHHWRCNNERRQDHEYCSLSRHPHSGSHGSKSRCRIC